MSSSSIARRDPALVPQHVPEGRDRVVDILAASGVTDPAVADRIMAAVQHRGIRKCTCTHVEGGSDPAHQHTFYDCEKCGGLCTTERWSGHEVMTLNWYERMRQYHQATQALVRGLNFAQDGLQRDIVRLAQTVPAERLHAAIQQRIRDWMTFVCHYVLENTQGNFLYQKRHETEPGRTYEWDGDDLTARLVDAKRLTPEAYMDKYPVALLTEQEAMERASRVWHTHALATRLGFPVSPRPTKPAALTEASPGETLEFAAEPAKVEVF